MVTWPLGLLPMGIEAEEKLDMTKIKCGGHNLSITFFIMSFTMSEILIIFYCFLR